MKAEGSEAVVDRAAEVGLEPEKTVARAGAMDLRPAARITVTSWAAVDQCSRTTCAPALAACSGSGWRMTRVPKWRRIALRTAGRS